MKQTAVELIRDWVRTNGKMSEDGQSITYNCKDIENVIKGSKQMEMEEQDKIYDHAFKYGQLSAPELSDEEIEKAFTIGTTQKTEYTHKIEGAKWYREQLKSKQ